MKIEVIIPVVNYDLAMALLHQINENTRPPNRVIIINNTQETHSWYPFENFIIEFYYTESKRLNESWEVGRAQLSPNCDYITFLNDDLIMGNWFFQRVIDTFKANEKYGIVCPNTVDHCNKVLPGKVEYVVGRSRKLEAWAFTIRKNLLDEIPPVPWERISTFHGDTWVWEHVKRMGHFWGKDLGNNIYHYVGQSILKFGFRSLKRPERNEWNKIVQETWGDK